VTQSIANRSKYWDRQIKEIKFLVLMLGYTVNDVAKFYGVSHGSIRSVLSHRQESVRRWRHDFNKVLLEIGK
jgi:hypothetical protein